LVRGPGMHERSGIYLMYFRFQGSSDNATQETMEIEKIKTKICIVGAGPAGATTSIFLGKMGIPHVIVDASTFPRDKICGDGLDLNVVRVLNHIDPEIVKNELAQTDDFTASEGMRFILPNGKHVNMMRTKNGTTNPLAKQPIFFVSKRSNFDNLLVEKIDRSMADIRLRTRIDKIEKDGDTWKLQASNETGKIEIETTLLIGADGDHSIVLKHVGERKIDRNHYAGAVRQYWKGVEGMHADNLIEVYFPKSLPLSYFWIFPLPNGEANVGYGMASSYIAKKNINVRKAFAELIKTDPLLMERFKNAEPKETIKGWGVPMSSSKRKAHGDGWLLVGDAASIVCPTSGEGVGSGMISGYTAALFIQRAVQQNDFSENMFTNYDREIHKRLGMEEKVFRFVNRIPSWAFTAGLNTVLSSRLFQKWLANKEMQKWVETAYRKKIVVNM
jgi:geranylgeranyl reductase family protein